MDMDERIKKTKKRNRRRREQETKRETIQGNQRTNVGTM